MYTIRQLATRRIVRLDKKNIFECIYDKIVLNNRIRYKIVLLTPFLIINSFPLAFVIFRNVSPMDFLIFIVIHCQCPRKVCNDMKNSSPWIRIYMWIYPKPSYTEEIDKCQVWQSGVNYWSLDDHGQYIERCQQSTPLSTQGADLGPRIVYLLPPN